MAEEQAAADARLDARGMLALDPFNPCLHVYPLYVHLLDFNAVASQLGNMAVKPVQTATESTEGGNEVIAWVNAGAASSRPT